MNTLWVYRKDEANLRDKLMGMEFDRAILSEVAQIDMNTRAHILTRVRTAQSRGTQPPAPNNASHAIALAKEYRSMATTNAQVETIDRFISWIEFEQYKAQQAGVA